MTIDVMMRDIRVIPLDKIKLDKENVRFGNDVAESQLEALKLMLSDPEEAKKILRLAEHIVQHGLDPTELQLVMPDEEGNFVVLEGNRRLTALKLLQRPDLCPPDRSYKGFLRAHNKLPDGIPQYLQCSVVPDRAAGDMWVELKHTGENRGVGRVDWNSNIRDERRARTTGIQSIGRQLRNLIKENPDHFSAKAALDCMEIDVTTLTRIFSSAPGQATFRLKVENKILVPQLPLEYIAPAVEFMLDMFISLEYNVNDVRSEADRVRTIGQVPEEYLAHNVAEAAKLKNQPAQPVQNSPESAVTPDTSSPVQTPDQNSTAGAEIHAAQDPNSNPIPIPAPTPAATPTPDPTSTPNQEPTPVAAPTPPSGSGQPADKNTDTPINGDMSNGGVSGTPNPNSAGSEASNQGNLKPGGTANANPEPPKDQGIRAKPQARARKYLIAWSLSISNARINAIYRELRSILIVDECPNATAITFRVFMETTCDDYIQRKKDAGDPIKRWDTGQELRGGGNGDKLSQKIQSVVKHLEGEKLLATPAAKAIIKRATSYDQTGSVDHLNLFVHGTHSLPLASELKDIAVEYRPLMEAIWR